MNIIINIDPNKIENTQPILYNIGEVTTTLQDLLDETTITIYNYRPIVLEYTDINGTLIKSFLNLKDYLKGSQYGLGENITENDLIIISNNSSSPSNNSKVYHFLFSLISGEPDIIELENTFTNSTIISRVVGEGYYKISSEGAFTSGKFSITSGFSYATEYTAIYDDYNDNEIYINICNVRNPGVGDDGPIVRLPIKIEVFE